MIADDLLREARNHLAHYRRERPTDAIQTTINKIDEYIAEFGEPVEAAEVLEETPPEEVGQRKKRRRRRRKVQLSGRPLLQFAAPMSGFYEGINPAITEALNNNYLNNNQDFWARPAGLIEEAQVQQAPATILPTRESLRAALESRIQELFDLRNGVYEPDINFLDTLKAMVNTEGWSFYHTVYLILIEFPRRQWIHRLRSSPTIADALREYLRDKRPWYKKFFLPKPQTTTRWFRRRHNIGNE